MARVDVDQIQVLESIVDLLRADLSLSEDRCFFSLDPNDIRLAPAGDYWLVITPGEANFPADMQVGGGQHQCTEDGDFEVVIHSRCKLDKVGSDAIRMMHATRGLLAIKKLVLRCLVDAEPTLPDGSTFVREQIPIYRSRKATWNSEKQVATLALVLGISWDWDLS